MEGASEVEEESSKASAGRAIRDLWHGISPHFGFETLHKPDPCNRLSHPRCPSRPARDVLAGMPDEIVVLRHVARGSPRCHQGLRRDRPLQLPAGGDTSAGLHIEQVVTPLESLENQRLAAVLRLNDSSR